MDVNRKRGEENKRQNKNKAKQKKNKTPAKQADRQTNKETYIKVSTSKS